MSTWTSKTVYTGIITGCVAIAKAVSEVTGGFVIPDGTVEAFLGLTAVFMRMGILKVQRNDT